MANQLPPAKKTAVEKFADELRSWSKMGRIATLVIFPLVLLYHLAFPNGVFRYEEYLTGWVIAFIVWRSFTLAHMALLELASAKPAAGTQIQVTSVSTGPSLRMTP